ncbi:hypothetical protein KEM55_001759, partial [Ascosphaera atra]
MAPGAPAPVTAASQAALNAQLANLSLSQGTVTYNNNSGVHGMAAYPGGRGVVGAPNQPMVPGTVLGGPAPGQAPQQQPMPQAAPNGPLPGPNAPMYGGPMYQQQPHMPHPQQGYHHHQTHGHHGHHNHRAHHPHHGRHGPAYPPANPADQNPPCNTLYVGNLPHDTSEDELKALFSKQRGYKRLCFRNKQNGPMCFVEFEDISAATKVLTDLYGWQLSNSVKGGIRLSFSKNPLGVRNPAPMAG